ncbi:MAG: DUF4982 domain-containing protein [Bacteroidales bacterium]|nr:DUF4982 domain-containing protein [Bacteroidales bacterium]
MLYKNHINRAFIFCLLFFSICSGNINSQDIIRKTIELNDNWQTIADDNNINAYGGFEAPGYKTKKWETVDIPHNWDKYEGYRRKLHGNRHGYAWYRKEFTTDPKERGKRYFLFFEGVGSYATVWVNGKKVGCHAGGRTTFTLDITDAIKPEGGKNLLAVRSDHPANIRDLPWVCGGCSDEWGFSEGSQPMGIFRPVSLIITNDIRVAPFGIHIWNDTSITEKQATLYSTVEIVNDDYIIRNVKVTCRLKNKEDSVICEISKELSVLSGESFVMDNVSFLIDKPHLWSLDDPYLYTMETEISANGKVLDRLSTKYGIRCISWPIYRKDGDNRFFLNGEPVFINGTAEYEHNMGQSHAFTAGQIRTRVMQVKAAGFNAFRDGHQPHNLRYQENWDSLGILFWPQMAAHIWFDTPAFRENFKQLLRDWIKERRNCPSVILWGLENESTLPTDFAQECVQVIREMDPTSPSQRLVTTCNGGTGTDWNVVQNWSGTYAGDLYNYDKDISRELLNGEYGAWRSLDLHTEGPFQKDGAYSEDRMCQLMETKVRLAEKAKDSCCGQFQWIFNSHDNPGRTQNGEGYRELDRIGPVNYKGLFTPWGEPADVFYMYRANYAPKETEPMVYIVSHTWPNRWTEPGIKDSIVVYSNCDEVELFNDKGIRSLGVKENPGKGNHFQWDSVEINSNLLYAVGYIDHLPVAADYVCLHHLPVPPGGSNPFENGTNMIFPEDKYNYIYRVNCGGPEYTDVMGNTWMADQHKESDTSWGSLSWTDEFKGLPNFYASQRRTFDPIRDCDDWKLLQTFRFGREKLRYEFPLPDGDYIVELYFVEPWYGTGGGMDCEGWRMFDVAINGEVEIKNLDIWKEAGHDRVLKKAIPVKITGGELVISFPKVTSGQALISAIAIATKNKNIKPGKSDQNLIKNLRVANIAGDWKINAWMDLGDRQYKNEEVTFSRLPSNFFGATWIMTENKIIIDSNDLASFTLNADADIFIAIDRRIDTLPQWLSSYIEQKTKLGNDKEEHYRVYAKRGMKDDIIKLGTNGEISEGSINMYTVVICPVNSLGQASDQRPTKRYQAEEAILKGAGLKKLEFNNREYIEFSRAEGDTIEWEFSVGLGDVYTLRFQYLNNSEESIPMRIKIIDSYGIVVKNDIIEFDPRKESWRTLTTTTGTSINAGKYKVRMTTGYKAGLGIDRMDVQ